MTATNRQITLAARPVGLPKETDFRLIESPMPEPASGEILVRSLFLSVDPYMRARMGEGPNYADPVGIGDVMVGEVVGEVVGSNNPRFSEGTLVAGLLGWQEYAVTDGSDLRPVLTGEAPISTALHVLGMAGLTAYVGLLDICQAREGDTVVVSAAAGAVGSIVGQIARIHGCRVIGIAGSDSKVEFIVKELGFDGGFNYKTTEHYTRRLAELCPDGIDVYFDNVGGSITDAVFPLLRLGARIGICGQISQYNLEKPELGPRLLAYLIIKRARIQGFLVLDHFDRYPQATAELGAWMASGRLKVREQIADGLENAPAAFIGMLQGANTGKQLVRIAAHE